MSRSATCRKSTQDAVETLRWVDEAGAKSLDLPGDLRDEEFCAEIVERTVAEFGGLDILVLNAAYQKDREALEQPRDERTRSRVPHQPLRAGVHGAGRRSHLAPGASIIVTSSIQAFNPSPSLVDYAMTKAAQVAFVKALAAGARARRASASTLSRPGPIWTPLIPATGWDAERLESFGQDTPLGRAGQPAELAGAYVYLASDDASYVSGAVVPVTGGKGL